MQTRIYHAKCITKYLDEVVTLITDMQSAVEHLTIEETYGGSYPRREGVNSALFAEHYADG